MTRSFWARAVRRGPDRLAAGPGHGRRRLLAGRGLPDSVGINSMWVIDRRPCSSSSCRRASRSWRSASRGARTRHGRREDPGRTSRSRRSCTGRSASRSRSAATLGHVIGDTGFFLRDYGDPQTAFPIMGFSDATIEAKWFFQFAFCAVSLAIVWGTTLERIKFGVYIIYAVVFSALIYPIVSGWVFGGGWLQVNVGMQDFAGSTAVHLIGATGAPGGAAAARAAQGQVRARRQAAGDPRPQHAAVRPGRRSSCWSAGSGSTRARRSNALDGRFAEVAMVTLLAACAGVLGAVATTYVKHEDDRHRHGRQRHDRRARRDHGALGLRGAVGRRRHRPRRRRHRAARRATRSTRSSTTRSARSPRTAWRASGARSRAACSRCRRSRSSTPSVTAASCTRARSTSSATRRSASSSCSPFVFVTSYATFWVIKATYGLRVTRGGGCRPRHLRARHVRLPGAVHPGARARGLRCGPAVGGAPRAPRRPRPDGGAGMKKVDGIHPARGVRADPHGAARPRVPLADDQRGQGLGTPEGHHRAYRGAELTNYLRPEGQARVRRRRRVTCRRSSTRSSSTRRTGAVGDGKVFVLPVEEAYRVRTGRVRRGESSRPTRTRPRRPPRAGALGRERGGGTAEDGPPPRAAASPARRWSSGCAASTSRWSTPCSAATAWQQVAALAAEAAGAPVAIVVPRLGAAAVAGGEA